MRGATLLRLQGLSASGFKSFADRTELSFPDGITCIVGPNGCGKSNVLDAVSWVLGEQSAKTLRGSAMQDVIFAGSRSRRPAGMAEVSLRFTPRKSSGADADAAEADENPVLPETPDARLSEPLEVTRRLYRSGDSEYLINGEKARLKDIQALIRGTGMGTRVYSIIEQGRVDQILNSKPTDRRSLIEEAAGITGYRLKRRQAKLKLEDSERNLERVTDIILEIEKQLRSLKRQASTARRYKRLAGRQRIVLRALIAVKHDRLTSLLDEAEVELEQLASGEDEMARELSRLEESSATSRQRVAEVEAERDAVVRQAHAVHLELDRARSVLQASRERIAEGEERAERNAEAARQVAARLAELETRCADARSHHERLGAELAEVRAALSERTDGTRQVKDRLAETHRRIADAKETIFEVMSEAAGLRNRKQELEDSLSRLARNVERLAERKGESEAVAQRLGAELEVAEARLSDALSIEGDLRLRVERLGREASELAEQASDLRSTVEDVRGRRRDSEARLAATSEMVRTRAAFAEGVRDLLDEPPEGVLGTVADFLVVPEGDEQAVEKALAAALQAVVFESREVAATVLGARARAGESEVDGVFPTGAETAAPPPAPMDDPRVVGVLSQRVRVDERVAWLAALLPQAILVERSEDAFALAAEHPERTVVSRDGAVAGPGGWASGGRPRGDGPGILETRARQEALTREVASLREEDSRLASRLADVESRSEAVATSRDTLRDELAEAEKETVSARQGALGVRREADGADSRWRAIDAEHGAAAAELAAGRERSGEFDERLADCQIQRESLERQLAEDDALAARLEADVEGADAELSRLREELAVKGERREAASAELVQATRELEQEQQRQAEIEAEREALAASESRARETIAEMEQAIGTGTARHAALETELSEVEQRVSDGRRELVESAERLTELRHEHDRRAKAAANARVKRERLASRLEHLVEDCRKDLQLEPEDLEMPTPPVAELDELADLGDSDAGDDVAVSADAAASDSEGSEGASESGATVEMAEGDDAVEETGASVAASGVAVDGVIDGAVDGVVDGGVDGGVDGAEGADGDDGAEADDGDGDEDDGDADTRLQVVIDESLPWVEGELDIEALELEAEELRARLTRIGPVNLIAIEEYDELAERHGFLATERDDLVESIESLRRTIDQIDDLSRRLFLEAFEEIKGSFNEAFETLFRGGRAELRLQEGEDPLECGIEIIAQPPGKRLQNMMLLSGGEKALTAIALLFALFRFKPSPFCILDEVDAPLDEANVVRFVTLVEELAKDTQFIVITHDRRTMERGDVLYGVTMEEPGCSKLVSVHFEGLRESAA